MIPAPRTGRLSVLTLTVLLAGAGALLAPSAAPATPATPAVLPAVSAPPAAVQGTWALESALPAVTAAGADKLTGELTALADAKASPNRAEMLQAFAAAGFPEESVEVSLDITPTGLAVDSVRGAAIHEGECLFGEVREGKVDVTVLPVLDSGFCFVGDQR